MPVFRIAFEKRFVIYLEAPTLPDAARAANMTLDEIDGEWEDPGWEYKVCPFVSGEADHALDDKKRIVPLKKGV